MRHSKLSMLAAITALGAVVPASAPRGGMGGGPMSPEEKERRDAEKQSRRAFKIARAEAKRLKKAERRAGSRRENRTKPLAVRQLHPPAND